MAPCWFGCNTLSQKRKLTYLCWMLAFKNAPLVVSQLWSWKIRESLLATLLPPNVATLGEQYPWAFCLLGLAKNYCSSGSFSIYFQPLLDHLQGTIFISPVSSNIKTYQIEWVINAPILDKLKGIIIVQLKYLQDLYLFSLALLPIMEAPTRLNSIFLRFTGAI